MKKLLRSSNTALLAVTVAILLVFYAFNPNFLSLENIRNIMNSMSFVGVLTVGMTMLLICGEVDLSSGAIACFGGVVAALLINSGVPWVIGLILTILFGAICGLISALMINRLGFMNFIATLGLMSVFQGAVALITQNKNIQIPVPDFWVIGSTTLFGLIPLPFVIMILLMVLYGLILSSTNFGRSIYMCGGNRYAARLCGINPKRVSSILYINNGALCALAGAILAALMHTASPVAGNNGALDAITAAVLGGVSFLGGTGGMVGCFIGIFLLNAFDAGLTAIGFPSYWQLVARGCLLVLALCLDFVSSQARRRALEQA